MEILGIDLASGGISMPDHWWFQWERYLAPNLISGLLLIDPDVTTVIASKSDVNVRLRKMWKYREMWRFRQAIIVTLGPIDIYLLKSSRKSQENCWKGRGEPGDRRGGKPSQFREIQHRRWEGYRLSSEGVQKLERWIECLRSAKK
jgi:hypothetical protein